MTTLVLQALHLLSAIVWLGTMLVLPVVFARRASLEAGSPGAAPLDDLAKRIGLVMTVGLVLTWAFGIALIANNSVLMKQGWLHTKLLLVVLLSGGHGFLAASRKKIEAGTSQRPAGFWLGASAVGGVLLVAVVFLAKLKPF